MSSKCEGGSRGYKKSAGSVRSNSGSATEEAKKEIKEETDGN